MTSKTVAKDGRIQFGNITLSLMIFLDIVERTDQWIEHDIRNTYRLYEKMSIYTKHDVCEKKLYDFYCKRILIITDRSGEILRYCSNQSNELMSNVEKRKHLCDTRLAKNFRFLNTGQKLCRRLSGVSFWGHSVLRFEESLCARFCYTSIYRRETQKEVIHELIVISHSFIRNTNYSHSQGYRRFFKATERLTMEPPSRIPKIYQ